MIVIKLSNEEILNEVLQGFSNIDWPKIKFSVKVNVFAIYFFLKLLSFFLDSVEKHCSSRKIQVHLE